MKELQRWQNNLEIDFFKFGENPFSYQLFEENQKSRDKLFEYCMGQVKEKISKVFFCGFFYVKEYIHKILQSVFTKCLEIMLSV